MATRMQQRRGLASQWTAANPVLAAGEIGFETDTKKFKMGDGTSTWSQLVYFANATELTDAINSVIGMAPETLNTLSEIADALGDDPNFLSALATNARVDNVVLGGAAQAQAAATAAATALASHNSSTTDVHGIANTALLATLANVATAKSEAIADTTSQVSTAVAALTKSSVGLGNVDNTSDLNKPVSNDSLVAIETAKTEAIAASSLVTGSNILTHNDTTENVHGIEDTSLLATKAYADDAEADAITAAGYAADTKIWNHNLETENVHGIANTADLVTTADLIIALDGAAGEYQNLAGEGIEWDSVNEQFDIDETVVATRVYAENTADTKIATAIGALTPSSVGLTSVDNTADLAKPVSTVQATAIATAKTEAITEAATAADTKVSAHNTGTTNVHGIADTSILATTTGAQTLSNKTLTTPTINGPEITATGGTPRIHGIYLPEPHGITFEGSTTDEFETFLTVTNPTADRTVSLPDASGTLQLRVEDVSDVEIGYLNGVTSGIQTQLDAKASLSGATFTGSVEIDQNLVVDGNLTVNGTSFNTSSTSIVIEDNMVQLAHQNAANTVDLGIVVGYNDGATKHSGIVRDVSANTWKIFKDVTTEPTTTVDFAQGSLDDLQLNNLTAAGVVFVDGTQTKVGVPSITTFATEITSSATLAAGEADKFVPLNGAVVVTLPATGYSTGQSIDFWQSTGTGASFASTNGVVGTPGYKFRTTNSVVTAMKTSAGWLIFGDLAL
jgi:hypothetical protein